MNHKTSRWARETTSAWYCNGSGGCEFSTRASGYAAMTASPEAPILIPRSVTTPPVKDTYSRCGGAPPNSAFPLRGLRRSAKEWPGPAASQPGVAAPTRLARCSSRSERPSLSPSTPCSVKVSRLADGPRCAECSRPSASATTQPVAAAAASVNAEGKSATMASGSRTAPAASRIEASPDAEVGPCPLYVATIARANCSCPAVLG